MILPKKQIKLSESLFALGAVILSNIKRCTSVDQIWNKVSSQKDLKVKFTFDTGLLQGKTLVVFEGLYDEKGNVIVTHNDLTDADQTVSVPAKPSVPPVITGDDSSPMPYVAALAVLLLAAAAVVLVLVRRRKKA